MGGQAVSQVIANIDCFGGLMATFFQSEKDIVRLWFEFACCIATDDDFCPLGPLKMLNNGIGEYAIFVGYDAPVPTLFFNAVEQKANTVEGNDMFTAMFGVVV